MRKVGRAGILGKNWVYTHKRGMTGLLGLSTSWDEKMRDWETLKKFADEDWIVECEGARG